jgi:hypothetical protein
VGGEIEVFRIIGQGTRLKCFIIMKLFNVFNVEVNFGNYHNNKWNVVNLQAIFRGKLSFY